MFVVLFLSSFFFVALYVLLFVLLVLFCFVLFRCVFRGSVGRYAGWGSRQRRSRSSWPERGGSCQRYLSRFFVHCCTAIDAYKRRFLLIFIPNVLYVDRQIGRYCTGISTGVFSRGYTLGYVPGCQSQLFWSYSGMYPGTKAGYFGQSRVYIRVLKLVVLVMLG